MKHLIRKILREDRIEGYMNKVLSDVQKNLEKGKAIDAKKIYALPPEIVEKFEERAIRKLYRLEGDTIDIDAFQKSVSLGGYYFKFDIGKIIFHGNFTVSPEQPYLSLPSGEYQEISVNINNVDGSVDLLDGGTEELPQILGDEEIGWEVKSEMTDIIDGIVHLLVPEIVASNIIINIDIESR
jgi:hypothetical protein